MDDRAENSKRRAKRQRRLIDAYDLPIEEFEIAEIEREFDTTPDTMADDLWHKAIALSAQAEHTYTLDEVRAHTTEVLREAEQVKRPYSFTFFPFDGTACLDYNEPQPGVFAELSEPLEGHDNIVVDYGAGGEVRSIELLDLNYETLNDARKWAELHALVFPHDLADWLERLGPFQTNTQPYEKQPRSWKRVFQVQQSQEEQSDVDQFGDDGIGGTADNLEPYHIHRCDFPAWAMAQADALREGRWADLDIDNLVHEVQWLAAQNVLRIRTRLRAIAIRLMQSESPVGYSRESSREIARSAEEIRNKLEESRSLKAKLPSMIRETYNQARQAIIAQLDENSLDTPVPPEAPTPEFLAEMNVALQPLPKRRS